MADLLGANANLLAGIAMILMPIFVFGACLRIAGPPPSRALVTGVIALILLLWGMGVFVAMGN